MKPRLVFCLFLCFFLFYPAVEGDETLADVIRDRAIRASVLHRSSSEFTVPLPDNLSGVEASAMRLRSRALWLKGANLSSFQFPPGILPQPYERRVLIVCHSLGNWSSSLYRNIPGYTLASQVVGLFAYDNWNVNSGEIPRELGFVTTGETIRIAFPESKKSTERYCARFGAEGAVSMEGEAVMGRCSTNGTGYFGVVVRDSFRVGLPPPPVASAGAERRWNSWALAYVGGFLGLVLLGVLGILMVIFVRRKKEIEMRKEADEGEELRIVWVGGSRMPCAGLTRTQPVLESSNAP
ncbi:hypothetical protein HPP92_007472 [Vanilla planifolia]|uniref:Uncharacterized protein n=1 Tax=Vanilla planifolia TaxID=51239 RepID=A0A835RG69_VANPL|nr:hypothetical protein HPP92_007472 [Vanilla planifolia]